MADRRLCHTLTAEHGTDGRFGWQSAGVKNRQPYELQISGKYMNFRFDENRNKYIAEDPEYNEGQQYEDIFFEYDENIEEFYKITN